MPGEFNKIVTELKHLNIPLNSIKNILLTHHDVDHTGNVKALQEATEADVWIGSQDEPYLMHKKDRPGVKHIIESVLRVKPPASCRTFSGINQIDEIHVIFTPGHTPGHHIFQYDSVLFTGDLFKTTEKGFKSMSPAMNWDQKQLQSSISKLRTVSFEWLCPAHGNPIKNTDDLWRFIEKD